MDQAFNTFLNFDKRSVRDKVRDPSSHRGTDWESLFYLVPRVTLSLFETERHALFLLVDIENDNIDLLTNLEKFARMSEPAPSHISDVK